MIELAEDVAGEMVGKVLAQLGAEVLKVEPPGGAPTRHVGPRTVSSDPSLSSLTFRHYNVSKRSVVLDPAAEPGRTELARLLGSADVLVVSMPPARQRALGLAPGGALERHARLIVASVTPFGPDGPWANWATSDLVGLALGGPLHTCGYDDHSIPPIRPGGDQGYQSAASFALIGVALALIDRERTGRGQRIEIPMHECLAVNTELAVPYWIYPGVVVERQTCRHAQPSPTQPALFECADGRHVYLVVILADQKPWDTVVGWLASRDMALDLTDPEYADPQHRQGNFAHIQDVLECFFLLIGAEEAYHEGQARGLPIGILNAPEEVLADEHLAARGFFEEVIDADGRRARYATVPVRISGRASPPMTSAPSLGLPPLADVGGDGADGG